MAEDKSLRGAAPLRCPPAPPLPAPMCDRIRIAYNNAFRILHKIPRCISVRSYQVEDNIELLML